MLLFSWYEQAWSETWLFIKHGDQIFWNESKQHMQWKAQCGDKKPVNIKAIDLYRSLVHYYILSEWYTDDDTVDNLIK